MRLARRSFGPLPSVVLTGATTALEESRVTLLGAGASELDAGEMRQLRVEAGVPQAGNELTEDHHPLEAGLSEDLSFTKGCYTGQEVVSRQDSRDKIVRALVGLVFEGSPNEGEALASEDKSGCRVTTVAPGRPSPARPTVDPSWPGGPACLGYVRSSNGTGGTAVRTAGGLQGVVVELPFPALRGTSA